MKKILIVDDHPLIREGLKRTIVSGYPDFVVGEASNAAETLNSIWNQPWDLVILDISLPGKSGLELLKEIRAQKPKLPVLILSMHPEDQFAFRTLRAGASGYLSKSAPSEILIHAIRRVLDGGKFITGKVAELLANDLSGDVPAALHEGLSDREFDVLVRIGRGQSVGEIARELNLSVKTISTYRTRVLSKTGLRSNAAIVQYAIRNKLVE